MLIYLTTCLLIVTQLVLGVLALAAFPIPYRWLFSPLIAVAVIWGTRWATNKIEGWLLP